jgi:hypothetical protein
MSSSSPTKGTRHHHRRGRRHSDGCANPQATSFTLSNTQTDTPLGPPWSTGTPVQQNRKLLIAEGTNKWVSSKSCAAVQVRDVILIVADVILIHLCRNDEEDPHESLL